MKQAFTSILLGALCLSLGLGLCACRLKSNQEQPSVQNHSELTQTESFPVKLELEETRHIISSRPRRLAVLSADLVQALEDIGAASLICGVSSDAPKDASTSGAKVCGTALAPELEQLIAAKPDWVLVSSQMRESQIASLEEQGITVLTFSRPKTLDEIQARYRQLFTLCYGLDGSAKATTFLTSYQSKLSDAIQPAADYAKLTGRKSAVYLAQLDYTMATGEVFEGKLLDQMGLNNLGELGSRWNYPEIEKDELKPDILFYDKTLTAEQIADSEVYAQSPAVQNGRLYEVDFSAIRLQGLPMIEELGRMARAAYPQAYGK